MHPKPYAKGNGREASYRSKAQKWYSSARWQARRAHQLMHHPLCAMCKAKGRVTAASIADHITPHKGNEQSFWFGALQSLCKPCHDGDKKRIEAGGKVKAETGLDGWPIG